MPPWLKFSIRLWALILLTIGPFLLVWYLWEPPSEHLNGMNLADTKLHERNGTRRHKRAVYVPERRWPELPKNPCNDSHNSDKTTSELYVCYNSTRFISTVVIPMSSFTIGGCKGSKWKGYEFYLNAIVKR